MIARHSRPRRLCAAVLAALLSACGQGAPDPAPAAQKTGPKAERPHGEDGIAWFSGSVDEAFALAREQNRPLFLYWGAVWCPPCNQLKSTVFRDPEFIRMTRQFIAVYIDGDAPGAQRLGERFGAMGYPTLIVFAPDGTEITRVTSGMELSRYPEVLALAARRSQPVDALLEAVLADSDSADDEALTLLAFYGWETSPGEAFGGRDPAAVFDRLARIAGEDRPLLANRFALLAAVERLRQGQLPDRAATVALLRSLLADLAQLRANLTELTYEAPALIAAATDAGDETRAELAAALQAAMDEAFDDESLPIRQRLLTTHALIALHERLQPGKPVPPELVAVVRERARWAAQAARTPYERQSLIYNAAGYLHRVGASDEARALYLAELERSLAPYYYMSYLADLEAELGHIDAALDWSRRAWQAAEGEATRAQWGIEHALRLLALAPQRADEIEATVGAVIDGIAGAPASFHQRTRVRMERLDAALAQWAASDPTRAAVRARLADRLAPVCQALDEGSAGRASCERFGRTVGQTGTLYRLPSRLPA